MKHLFFILIIVLLGTNLLFCQTPDILLCPFMETSPVLDGKIGKAEWFDGASFSGVIRVYPEPKGEHIKENIQYFLGHTSTHLWIAFRVYRDTRPRSTTSGRMENTSRVWQDDAIEIMLDVKGTQKNGINIAMNAKSDYADFKIYPPLKDKWNTKWDYRASSTSLGWEGELAIPWEKLETKVPLDGELWKFDLILNRKTPAVLVGRVGDHPRGKWTSMELRPFLRFSRNTAVPHVEREQEVWQLEAVNPSGKLVETCLTTQLYLRKVPGTFREERWEKSFQETLKKKGILCAEKSKNIRLAPFRKTMFAIDKDIAPGRYMQKLEMRDKKGNILYSQYLPFSKEPPVSLHTVHAFLEGNSSSVEASFPLMGKKAENGKMLFTFAVNGKELLKEEKKICSSYASTLFPHPQKLKTGDKVSITTVLYDAKGKILAGNRNDIVVPEFPEWQKNVPEITGSKVPYPWKKLQLSGKALSMSLRTYQFGGSILPRQIIANGKELFSAPPVLEAVLDNGKKTVLDFPGKILSCDGVNAKAAGQKNDSGIVFKYDSTTAFDGFVWNTLSLDLGKHTLRDLKMVFRFPKERGIYFGHTYKGSAPFRTTDYGNWGQIPENGLQLPFVYGLWLGDKDRGFTLALESDEFWNTSGKNGAVQIETEGNETLLSIHFLKGNTKKKENPVYSFGFQATPVRPYMVRNHTDGIFTINAVYQNNDPKGLEAWKKGNLGRLAGNGGNYGILWSKGDEWFGHPFVKPQVAENLRSITRTGEEKKEKYFYYCGWAGNNRTPEVENYQDEMARMPKAEWGAPDLFKQCPAGAWSSMYLAGVNVLIEKYGLYGVYMDQTTELSSCKNAAHGCGYIGEDGRLHPTFPIRKMRAFYMALYNLLMEKAGRDDFMIYSHNSTQPVFTPVDAFVSRRCAMEILAKETDHKRINSPERIFGGFNPVSTGIPLEATWWNGFHPTMFNNELMATLWLFGCTLKGVQWKMDSTFKEGYGIKEHAEQGVMRALRRISSPSLQFIPYWREKDYKTNFHSSCWIDKKEKRMLLILSNLTEKDRKESVTFPVKVTAADCVNGEIAAKDAFTLLLTIQRKSYRAFLVEYK